MHQDIAEAMAPVSESGRKPPTTLAEAFVYSIQRFHDREAIKPVDAPAITYAVLGDKVRLAVAALSHLGLEQGDRLAIYLPNGVDWAVFTYAAAMLGACVVPVNTRFRADELEYVLKGSDAKILITQHSFLSNAFVERLRDVAGGALGSDGYASIKALPKLSRIVLIDAPAEPGTIDYPTLVRTLKPNAELNELARARRGDEPMWVFWTSGTTSAPKGALLPQSAIELVWKWTVLAGYAPQDRVLMARPLFYIAGHFWTMLGPMLHGAKAVVSDLLTVAQLQALCSSEKVTVLSGNPLMLRELIHQDSFDPAAFAHIRLGYFGGSAMPVDEMKKIQSAIGFKNLIQTYGMTEFAGFILSTLPQDPIEVACASCGLPFTDVELKLVDPDTGKQVSDGEVGMLMVRGHKLIKYINLPDEAARKFIDEVGWYRSGDLMRLQPDGRYQFVGRSKDLIKVGGENVTAAEIESTLMKHPEIALAAVVGTPDKHRGEVPVAFLETKHGSPLDTGEFISWCKARMAPYKVPARFHWMRSDQWPITSSGKIAKHELARDFASKN